MDDLTAAIKAGDREALNQFLAKHRDGLKQWVRFRLGVPAGRGADQSDVVQEVSLTLWRSVKEFEGRTEAELVQWMQRYLRWRVIDLSRRMVLQSARQGAPGASSDCGCRAIDQLSADTISPSQVAVQREYEAAIRAAAAGLTNEQVTVLTLHDVDGVPLKEIARQLDASPVEVGRQYLAAREALRASGAVTEIPAAPEAGPSSRLARALERLGAGERQAVLLKHLEDFTMQEAAEVLDKSPAAVGAAVYRGIKSLKSLLAERSPHDPRRNPEHVRI